MGGLRLAVLTPLFKLDFSLNRFAVFAAPIVHILALGAEQLYELLLGHSSDTLLHFAGLFKSPYNGLVDYTVSAYLDRLKDVLSAENAFVVGEVSELKLTPKWAGFSLIDKKDGSILKCFMSVWAYKKSGVTLVDGLEVKVGGRPTIYKLRGTMSFWADALELVGEGALKRAYEELKKRLAAEGLFDRKRKIPECIERIGVITSKNGVVIHDFTKNLKKRNFSIFLRDSRVEGADAVSDLLSAISLFNTRADIDVLVVIRGGGSLESLQAFNDERVCRALFASRVPVIAGIGHDVDVPLAALVSDAMVSTPTAAATLVGRSWEPVEERYARGRDLLFEGFEGMISSARHEVISRAHAIIGGYRKIFLTFSRYEQAMRNGWRAIVRGLKTAHEDSARSAERITSLFGRALQRQHESVLRTEKLLDLMNPERTLRLGYSIAFDASGKVLKSAKSLKPGDALTAKFGDGEARAIVEKVLL